MWTCAACHEIVENDEWTACWKCGSSRSQAAQPKRETLKRPGPEDFRTCLRCGCPVKYAGRRKFHEGAQMGFWLGNLGELLVNREELVVYACQICGKLDFYIDGVGNDLRGDPEPG